MCGGLVFDSSKKSLHQTFFWRIIAYTVVGACLGFAGETLLKSLEFQLLGAIALTAMALVCLGQIFPKIFSLFSSRLRKVAQTDFFKTHPRLRGALLSGMPCPFLATIYAGSVLSGSAYIGGGLLFSHAVLTTPSLAYSWKFAMKLSIKWKWAKAGLKYLVILVMMINLAFFGARMFLAEKDVERLLLFCF